MPHREPPKPPPVEVDDVGRSRVPFLRPLEWMATALRSFREKPLPSTYFTDAQPVFDLFGTAQFENYTVEVVAGALGGIEVTGSRVPADSWRQYLSASVSHDDGTPGFSREIQFIRVVQDSLLGFPSLTFAVSRVPLLALDVMAVRNVSIPPDGRIGANLASIGAGARLTLRTLFVDYAIGEPPGGIS